MSVERINSVCEKWDLDYRCRDGDRIDWVISSVLEGISDKLYEKFMVDREQTND